MLVLAHGHHSQELSRRLDIKSFTLLTASSDTIHWFKMIYTITFSWIKLLSVTLFGYKYAKLK